MEQIINKYPEPSLFLYYNLSLYPMPLGIKKYPTMHTHSSMGFFPPLELS
jgi:hypothetical protein